MITRDFFFDLLRNAQFYYKNIIYVDLQEIDQAIRQREEAESAQQTAASSTTSAVSGRNPVRNGQQDHNAGFLSNTLTNIVVIVGFAAFAYTVKYVLRNIVE